MPHVNGLKRFCEIFRFREDIREKRLSAKSLTTLTWCRRNRCPMVVENGDSAREQFRQRVLNNEQ